MLGLIPETTIRIGMLAPRSANWKLEPICIKRIGLKYIRTNNALENSKIKEEKFLQTYNNPLSKTIAFMEADKTKVEN